MLIIVFRVTVVLCGSLQQLFHVEYLDTSIVLGMIQSVTILDQLLNKEFKVIRDNAFS